MSKTLDQIQHALIKCLGKAQKSGKLDRVDIQEVVNAYERHELSEAYGQEIPCWLCGQPVTGEQYHKGECALVTVFNLRPPRNIEHTQTYAQTPTQVPICQNCCEQTNVIRFFSREAPHVGSMDSEPLRDADNK